MSVVRCTDRDGIIGRQGDLPPTSAGNAVVEDSSTAIPPTRGRPGSRNIAPPKHLRPSRQPRPARPKPASMPQAVHQRPDCAGRRHRPASVCGRSGNAARGNRRTVKARQRRGAIGGGQARRAHLQPGPARNRADRAILAPAARNRDATASARRTSGSTCPDRPARRPRSNAWPVCRNTQSSSGPLPGPVSKASNARRRRSR